MAHYGVRWEGVGACVWQAIPCLNHLRLGYLNRTDMNEEAPERQTPTDTARSFVKSARQMQSLGEYGMALKTLDRGLERIPDSAMLHLAKGELFVASFNKKRDVRYLKKGLSCFAAALRRDPQNYLARLLSAQIYLKGRSYGRARVFLDEILKNAPGDERATTLLDVVKRKEAKAVPPAPVAVAEASTAEAPVAEEDLVPDENDTAVAVDETTDDDDAVEAELVIDDALEANASPASADSSGVWDPEEFKVVIATSEADDEEELMQETLAGKLTIFSRLDGLLGIFLLDQNGVPFKTLNKAKLDENALPTLVFNLFKASSNGMRRAGVGSFQRGTLNCPIGVVLVANAFYATVAVVVNHDANMATVETRLQRYLSEVTQ